MRDSKMVWGRGWIGPHESLASLVMKWAWANNGTIAGANRLFGVKGQLPAHQRPGRTFADAGWFTLRGERGPLRGFGAGEVASRFLSADAGVWGMALANRVALRYCPQCLRHGYHASVHQLAALQCCPIHGDELRESCMDCGAPAPAFGLDMELIKWAFGCSSCHARFLNRDGIAPWSDTEEFHLRAEHALAPLYAWLQKVQRVPLPTSLAHKISEPPFLHNGVEAAKVAFWCAESVVPATLVRDCLERRPTLLVVYSVRPRPAETTVAKFVGPGFDSAQWWPIYKAVGRHIRARYLDGFRRFANESKSYLQLPPGLYSVIGNDSPGVAQAFRWWRLQFEGFERSWCFSPFFVESLHRDPWAAALTESGLAHLMLSSFFALCATTEKWLIEDERLDAKGSQLPLRIEWEQRQLRLDAFVRGTAQQLRLVTAEHELHSAVVCRPEQGSPSGNYSVVGVSSFAAERLRLRDCSRSWPESAFSKKSLRKNRKIAVAAGTVDFLQMSKR